MKIFIAGAGGYIGTSLVKRLLTLEHDVIALDRYFFGQTLRSEEDNKRLTIIKDDIRSFDKSLLVGTDISINLAAISNDPASELNPLITKSINYRGAVRFAKLSKEFGVRKHLFISSCSVYGAAKGEVTEISPVNPISEYAKSKVQAEMKIIELKDNNFFPTVFRLATIFGLSPSRMRFDLIINIMTLSAFKYNRINILGGGKQWRPLLHIDDCIRAVTTWIEKESSKLNGEIFNVGSNKDNYQVFQVAQMFKTFFPEVVIEEIPEDPDNRSYRVNFDKVRKTLGFRTEKTISDAIFDIKSALENGEISDTIETSTLKYYQYVMEADDLLKRIKLKNKLF